MEELMSNIYGPTGVWFLMGAALVFFMQAGFAMVEAGFTRAKNAGNIIMKNLMDFCIGTVVFVFLGGGLLLGQDALGGFLGLPTMGLFTDFDTYDWYSFVFNLVFCATAATIVSGAMAERTKFSAYCIYSAVISAVVYPIEAHWVWGGGWLTRLAQPSSEKALPNLWISQAHALSTWSAVFRLLSARPFSAPDLANTPRTKTEALRLTPSPVTR